HGRQTDGGETEPDGRVAKRCHEHSHPYDHDKTSEPFRKPDAASAPPPTEIREDEPGRRGHAVQEPDEVRFLQLAHEEMEDPKGQSKADRWPKGWQLGSTGQRGRRPFVGGSRCGWHAHLASPTKLETIVGQELQGFVRSRFARMATSRWPAGRASA